MTSRVENDFSGCDDGPYFQLTKYREFIMAFSDQSQFNYLFDALAKKYPGLADADGVTSTFQFSELPMEATWVLGYDSDAYNLANATSLRLDGYFAPGTNLANAYQDYVLSIKPNAGSDNPDYQAASRKVNAANDALTAKASLAIGAYKVFIANNPQQPMSYSQWLGDPNCGGDGYADALGQLRTTRNDQAKLMTEIIAAVDVPLAAAQKAVNPWSETMLISEGGTNRTVPLVTLGGNLASDHANWLTYPPGQYDFDVTINASDVVTSPWKTTYDTETSASCFHVSTTVNIDSKRIINDTHYKLQVTAVGANTYPIQRGEWFRSDLIIPTTQIVQGSVFTNDSFFGYAGALHLIPGQVFVLYRPSIVLTMSTNVYTEEVHGAVTAGFDWVDIFGFHFDMSGGASLTTIGDAVTTTLTISAPQAQAPQIVGVQSKVAWNKHGPATAALAA